MIIGGKWGFIDKTGNYIVKPQFDDASPFSEGLAAVKVDNYASGLAKWGYIDKTGKYVVGPRFDIAGPFSDGLAEIGLAASEPDLRLSGYMDKTGTYIFLFANQQNK